VKRAAKAGPAAESTPAASQTVEPVVLTPITRDAERIGRYVHEDDYRALYMAKLDDRTSRCGRPEPGPVRSEAHPVPRPLRRWLACIDRRRQIIAWPRNTALQSAN